MGHLYSDRRKFDPQSCEELSAENPRLGAAESSEQLLFFTWIHGQEVPYDQGRAVVNVS